jgi:hypothetical protein
LLWMARLALLAILIIVGYMAFRARSGGWHCRAKPDILTLQRLVIQELPCSGLVLQVVILTSIPNSKLQSCMWQRDPLYFLKNNREFILRFRQLS